MSKNMLLLPLLALLVIYGSSCKHEGLQTFDTTNSVYFVNLDDNGFIDTNYVTFAYDDVSKTDSSVRIALMVTGSPAETDRPFTIVADPSSTAVAGKDYEALPASYQFPAHKVSDTISIKLLRAADLKQEEATLILDLQANTSFTTNIGNQGTDMNGKPVSSIRYRIFFSDILTKPLGWDDDVFGKFAPEKMDLICQLGGINAAWLNNGDEVDAVGTRDFTIKCGYLSELLKDYLLHMANAGTPVYYADGVTPMATDDGD